MSRTSVVTPYTQNQINAVLDGYGIDKNQLRTLDITTCPASLTEESGSRGGLLGLVGGLLDTVVGIVGGLLNALRGILS